MAVIAVISVLTTLLIPMLGQAQTKTRRERCVANLKEIGGAVCGYLGDHDQILPGPLRQGIAVNFNVNSQDEFLWHIAGYLDSPPSSNGQLADVLVCPSYRHKAPLSGTMEGRRCYMLNEITGPNATNPTRPFGNPDHPSSQPLGFSSLAQFGHPDELVAIKDMDKGNVNPTVSWWTDLPYEPVHGKHRNQLFFDWHVESVRW
jgi:prepilin-type processing-associated H-X9-DG protein